MIEEHALFIPPQNIDQRIWRYMDFAKFVSLLNSESLYFPTADNFEDVFEGSMPRREYEGLRDFFVSIGRPRDIEGLIAMSDKKQHAISCWHMNDYESAAMWKLYLSTNEGIAVQSTYRMIKQALDSSDLPIHLGKVNYIDYENEFFIREVEGSNTLYNYTHKRKSFFHEQELRAIINSWGRRFEMVSKNYENEIIRGQKKHDPIRFKNGINVKVDLQVLIQNIYVSPTAPKWVAELVASTCKRFGYNFNVIQSQLYQSPLY